MTGKKRLFTDESQFEDHGINRNVLLTVNTVFYWLVGAYSGIELPLSSVVMLHLFGSVVMDNVLYSSRISLNACQRIGEVNLNARHVCQNIDRINSTDILFVFQVPIEEKVIL